MLFLWSCVEASVANIFPYESQSTKAKWDCRSQFPAHQSAHLDSQLEPDGRINLWTQRETHIGNKNYLIDDGTEVHKIVSWNAQIMRKVTPSIFPCFLSSCSGPRKAIHGAGTSCATFPSICNSIIKGLVPDTRLLSHPLIHACDDGNEGICMLLVDCAGWDYVRSDSK